MDVKSIFDHSSSVFLPIEICFDQSIATIEISINLWNSIKSKGK